MAWCPSCRQEYVDTIKRCADCGTELVASLAEVAAAEAKRAAAAPPVTLTAPAEMLAGISRWLEQSRVPVERAEGRDELLIPGAVADQVEAALGGIADVEREGDRIRVLGPREDREPELPADPTIVNRSTEEIAADPSALVPKVLALFTSPSARARRWALDRLLELESRGVVTLADNLLWLVRQRFRTALFGAAKELADAPPAGLAVAIAAQLRTLDERTLPLALHLLTQIPDRALVETVLPFLQHDDPDVRAEADEVLMSAAGFDARFDAEAEPREREQAIQRWRDWIAKHPRARS